MNWFERFCRNLGLAVHNIRQPGGKQRQVIRKEVHEDKRGDVILRRTTIDEIEITRKDTTDGS